jgi:hypothetical protein
MITKARLKAAEDKFPLPRFVTWYYQKFPRFWYCYLGALFILFGVFMTAFNMIHKVIGIPTYIVCVMVIAGAVMDTVTAIQKRATFKKRASFLGISLQDYKNSL